MDTQKYADYISQRHLGEKHTKLPNPSEIAKMSKEEKIEVFKLFMQQGYSGTQALKMAKL